MSWSVWLCSLAALLSLRFTVAHNHSVETEIYHVSVGHLFLLRCHFADAHTNVTWSRAGRLGMSLPSGVEVREGLLWFLPVQASHDGTYTCEERSETGLLRMKFRVLVSTGGCPEPLENISIPQGVRGGLPCKQREIFRLNNTRNIRWMKDCHPVEFISLDENGYVWLPALSEKDAGTYTCLMDISLDGRTYTAARSIQLTVNNDTVLAEPELVFPRQEVVMVEVGKRVELKCLAYFGFSEAQGTLMYWTVEGNYIEDYEELKESWKYTHSRGRVYGLSTLSISKILPLFLNIPIHCNIMSPAGQKAGLVLLREADHTIFHTSVALCLTTFLALLALASVSLFKVDVVLAYRKLRGHFFKPAPDGKLYDGYVIFLYPETLSSDEAANFALQMLPAELEAKHGYNLYIRGRDNCPGEAFHNAVAATVRQCRRLIIVLSQSSTDGKTEETSTSRDDLNKLCYEHKIGIYDALIQNNPKVILVEIDDMVDYSRLPESLHYIKRKQGALKWKKDFLGTNKLTNLYSNRRFWKNLRYHMPPVPAGNHQSSEPS